MHRRMRVAVAIMLLAGALLVGVCILTNYWSQKNVGQPYRVFRTQEVEAIPQFDQLNKSVADALPPIPPGVQLEKEHSTGINAPMFLHGRYLHLDLTKPKSASVEVWSYYRTYFLANGWSQTGNYPLYEYSRNISCVEIWFSSLDVNDGSQLILITIWHDFRNQPFSPTVPEIPMALFGLMKDGKTLFAECPGRAH